MDMEEEIARAISAHRHNATVAWPEDARLARALMPLFRRAQAEARAQELRDFAADLDRYVGTSLNAESAARFARVKSKGIEQGVEHD